MILAKGNFTMKGAIRQNRKGKALNMKSKVRVKSIIS